MDSLKDLLKNKEKYASKMVEKSKYVSTEFQDYGYRLALKLGEEKNPSLYIKLAKEKPRAWLEQALSFAIDYPNAKNRGRLFMWKLKQLEVEYFEKKDAAADEKRSPSEEESDNGKNPVNGKPPKADGKGKSS